MRRVAAVVLALAASAAGVLVTTGAGEPKPYQVRAIFDTAFSLVPGEDVKMAGVKVGQISALEVTPGNRAAVVLDIDRPGFQDFRTDAHCTIRPQSLIGEKFVECTPTQPRRAGEKPAPPLPVIPAGREGAGQHLLPVSHTTRPIDLDLVGNTLRKPYRERLPIILGELGVGLAGNGPRLASAIERANPALQQTDRVLGILSRQNRVISKLVADSDQILAPLSAERQRVGDFVAKANTTAEATVARSRALAENVRRLPDFLHELRPTLQRLGSLADEMTPVLSDVHSVAPDVNRFIGELGPFAKAATPAFRSLGDASVRGKAALLKAKPVIAQLKSFADAAHPLADDLAALTASLKATGGVERFLDYVFFQMTSINGFDSLGHYLRAGLLTDTCATYATTQNSSSCAAKFSRGGGGGGGGKARAAGGTRATSGVLDYLLGS